MTTRAARFVDIPRLTELAIETHARSVYAGRVALDLRRVKGILMTAMQRHGDQPAESGMCVYVAETMGTIEGFIVGTLDRVYHVCETLEATDLFFIVSERGDPRHASQLLDEFLAWAKRNERVTDVRMGITGAIGDWQRTEALYKRKGLQHDGAIYSRSFQR